MKAVILARVSTKDQEEFGHSLPAQLKRLHEYAQKHNFDIVKEFSFSESAGMKIRKKFEEVLAYLKTYNDVKILLCQNVDRATRNFRDAVDLDEMRLNHDLEIHFVQEGFVINARSSGNEMFMWEAKVFIGKQYLNRLKDDTVRSQNYKVQNGECVSKAPIGYQNVEDPTTGKKNVVIDKEKAFLIRRLFDEYATGCYSIKEITLKAKEWGLTSGGRVVRPFGRSHIHFERPKKEPVHLPSTDEIERAVRVQRGPGRVSLGRNGKAPSTTDDSGTIFGNGQGAVTAKPRSQESLSRAIHPAHPEGIRRYSEKPRQPPRLKNPREYYSG